MNLSRTGGGVGFVVCPSVASPSARGHNYKTTNRKETKHEDIGTCNNLRDYATRRMRNKDTLNRSRRDVRFRIRNRCHWQDRGAVRARRSRIRRHPIQRGHRLAIANDKDALHQDPHNRNQRRGIGNRHRQEHLRDVHCHDGETVHHGFACRYEHVPCGICRGQVDTNSKKVLSIPHTETKSKK